METIVSGSSPCCSSSICCGHDPPEKILKNDYASTRLASIRPLRRRARADHEADGLYLLQVLDANGRTWLDPVLRPLERLTYRLMGVDSNKEQNWKQYTLAMLLFSLVAVFSLTQYCDCRICCR